MSERRGQRVRAGGDPQDGRNETEDERMDRNWNEILQELRVTQTGTQILTGFLLTIAFQPKFADLTNFQRTVYLILVGVAALTTALALAPVSMHRALFRQHLKKLTVETAHVILRVTLIGVALVLLGTVLLIFDVTVGRTAALWAVTGLLMLIIGIVLLPVILGRGNVARRPDAH
jgi:hypothetical protein